MNVVHTNQMEWVAAMSKGPFENRRKALGGEKLTCSLWELAPGKKSFPFHMHHVTEEALFVVSGHGKVRSQSGLSAIGPGDYVSFLPGQDAHQLINDGTEPLVYVGMAATTGVDIVEYPDSQKIAAAKGAPPNGKRFIFKAKDQADYFDGEL
jgi:uncharacterized cupin superfamily protein